MTAYSSVKNKKNYLKSMKKYIERVHIIILMVVLIK